MTWRTLLEVLAEIFSSHEAIRVVGLAEAVEPSLASLLVAWQSSVACIAEELGSVAGTCFSWLDSWKDSSLGYSGSPYRHAWSHCSESGEAGEVGEVTVEGVNLVDVTDYTAIGYADWRWATAVVEEVAVPRR